ncbi:hypothetical protein AVR70_03465 [Escherichia coli]|nr:hypothetical protein AVR70_03465 [Escherichia coli]
MALWVQPWQPVFFCHHDAVFTWSQHDSGGVAQMLAPKAKTPDYRATDKRQTEHVLFLAG